MTTIIDDHLHLARPPMTVTDDMELPFSTMRKQYSLGVGTDTHTLHYVTIERYQQCTMSPLCHQCIMSPLYYITTALYHKCTMSQLHYVIIVRCHQCIISPLYDITTVQCHQCTVSPLYDVTSALCTMSQVHYALSHQCTMDYVTSVL